jgi:arabinose-5-phosphate isomerase
VPIPQKGIGRLGITGVKDGLVGIITDGDLRRNLGKGMSERRVDDVMTPGFPLHKQGFPEIIGD